MNSHNYNRYTYCGPSQKELNERARRRFLTKKNTRWHGQRL